MQLSFVFDGTDFLPIDRPVEHGRCTVKAQPERLLISALADRGDQLPPTVQLDCDLRRYCTLTIVGRGRRYDGGM